MAYHRRQGEKDYNKKFFPSQWMAHLLTAFLAVSGSWVTLKQTQETTSANQLKAAYERIALLEQGNLNLIGRVIKLDAELTMLKARLEKGETPEKALFNFMDSIRSPAWIKAWEPEIDSFVMLHVNKTYETTYGKTNEFYSGKTDHQVHAKALADAYELNDMRVRNRRDFRKVEETVVIGGTEYTLKFWKFYIRLPDGRDAVAGLQVTEIK